MTDTRPSAEPEVTTDDLAKAMYAFGKREYTAIQDHPVRFEPMTIALFYLSMAHISEEARRIARERAE